MSLIKNDLLALKEKLESIEGEFNERLKDVEEKSKKFTELDNQLQIQLDKDDFFVKLNIGGKIFQSKLSTLLKIKDSMFYCIFATKIERNEDLPRELFFDRPYTYFPLVISYLKTKKVNYRNLSKFEKEDAQAEIQFYKVEEETGKKSEIDIEWDSTLSKAGMCTVDRDDPRTVKVHSTTCYTHFVTNKLWNSEDFVIELASTVTQTDSYYYIGIVNENYNYSSSCMCCNPQNSFYIKCDGTLHINSAQTTEYDFAWQAQPVTIGMRVYLSEKKMFFYIPDKREIGPYTLVGNNFRVVAGHCNTGNGTITITTCTSLDS
jgi:hypothetical protein